MFKSLFSGLKKVSINSVPLSSVLARFRSHGYANL